jgi:hypothetical protein
MYTYIYMHIYIYMTGVWRHVLWTLSRSTTTSTTGTWNLYINGNFVATKSAAYFPTKATVYNYIGKSAFASDALYIGQIDSLAAIPWALTSSDASAVFRATGNMV